MGTTDPTPLACFIFFRGILDSPLALSWIHPSTHTRTVAVVITAVVQEGVLQSPRTLTQCELQQGEKEGEGRLDHSTGSLSEQPPLWWSVRGQRLCGILQCGQRHAVN